MSDLPNDVKYTESHEWVRNNGDGTATIGITDHAQGELGDVVYLDFAVEAGELIEVGGTLGTVESVKTVSDIYAPVDGKLNSCNDAIQDNPELVNSDPYGEGWLFQLEASGDLPSTLMDAVAYRSLIGIK